jgi:hypothetical protein
MGKGTGIKDKSSVAFGKMVYGSTGQMDETMSATKNTGGGMDANQRLMMAGGYSPSKSGKIHSGGHPKGGFMKKSTSYGNAKTGELEMVKKDGKEVPFYAADGDGENDLGTAKGKTAKSKLHQQKIHGKTYGYGKTIKPLVTVQADK